MLVVALSKMPYNHSNTQKMSLGFLKNNWFSYIYINYFEWGKLQFYQLQ